jgi:hypothetical protein
MNEPLVAIHDYYKALSTLDLNACASFFTLPCMFVLLQGTFPVYKRDELFSWLYQVIEALRTTHHVRTEFLEAQLTSLNEKTVLARGLAVRYPASGTELERIPVSYLVYQTGAAWRIAVVTSGLNFTL